MERKNLGEISKSLVLGVPCDSLKSYGKGMQAGNRALYRFPSLTHKNMPFLQSHNKAYVFNIYTD